MLDASSLPDLLFGTGGFSENFYWRMLLNFGWLGLFSTIALISVWFYYTVIRGARWRSPVGAWMIGVLAGCNGIGYLLTFPISLLFWSIAALLVRSDELSPALTADIASTAMRPANIPQHRGYAK